MDAPGSLQGPLTRSTAPSTGAAPDQCGAQQGAPLAAVGGDPLNERQVKLLNRLLDGFDGKLTSSKWAAIAKCSPDTALRDINELLTRGVLRKSEAGGRSTGYELIVRASERGGRDTAE